MNIEFVEVKSDDGMTIANERSKQAEASAHGCSTDGQYHVFAGRECSRALAMMSTDEKDCSNKLDDLNEQQKNTLEEWIVKFKKYPVVGKVSLCT